MRSIGRWLLVSAVCCFVSIVGRSVVALDEAGDGQFAPEELARVIENVRANEALYDDLELRLRSHYETGEAALVLDHDNFVTTTSQDETVWQVLQRGMFRIEVDAVSLDARAVEHLKKSRRAFDGATTRVNVNDSVCNTRKGRTDDPALCHPHMLLLTMPKYSVRLSTFLSGDEAMKMDLNGHSKGDIPRGSSYQGSDTYDGLRCHKVWSTSWIKEGSIPQGRWEIWLAEERNYMPVRILAYTFRYSANIPVGERKVETWQEVRPGIWFPLTASYVSYNSQLVSTQGEQKPSWRRTFTIEKIDLEPKYDRAFFQDIVFPERAAVYEVEDNEITSSYRVGDAEEARAAEPDRTPWWIVWVNVAVIAGSCPFCAQGRTG